jgi:hypothetical protein
VRKGIKAMIIDEDNIKTSFQSVYWDFTTARTEEERCVAGKEVLRLLTIGKEYGMYCEDALDITIDSIEYSIRFNIVKAHLRTAYWGCKMAHAEEERCTARKEMLHLLAIYKKIYSAEFQVQIQNMLDSIIETTDFIEKHIDFFKMYYWNKDIEEIDNVMQLILAIEDEDYQEAKKGYQETEWTWEKEASVIIEVLEEWYNTNPKDNKAKTVKKLIDEKSNIHDVYDLQGKMTTIYEHEDGHEYDYEYTNEKVREITKALIEWYSTHPKDGRAEIVMWILDSEFNFMLAMVQIMDIILLRKEI